MPASAWAYFEVVQVFAECMVLQQVGPCDKTRMFVAPAGSRDMRMMVMATMMASKCSMRARTLTTMES